MAIWDRLEEDFQKRRRIRRLALAALLVLLAGVCISALLLWHYFGQERPTTTSIPASVVTAAMPAADRPLAHDSESLASAVGDQGSPVAGTLGGLPLSAPGGVHESSLMPVAALTHLQSGTSPTFVKAAHRAPGGPSQIRIGTSSHSLGIAALTAPSLPGAAGEWTVRVWFRPAWIPDSVDCGQPGTTAIAGHVSWYGQPGPFHDLGAVTVGETVDCLAQDGRWYTYTVVEAVRVPYEDTRYYWRAPDGDYESVLSLFTCTPELDGIIVIRALLIEEPI
jgi:hypothetical protein